MIAWRKQSVEHTSGYLDPVGRRVQSLTSEAAKDLIYLQGESESFYQTRMMESTFTEFHPRSEVHQNALMLPYMSDYHIPKGGLFEHWAYTKELNPIVLADHYKPILIGYKDHSMLPVYPFKKKYPVKRYSGDHYYMGMLNPHYGHFIQESLTRFWLSLNEPGLIGKNTKFVFHVMANSPADLLDQIYRKNISQYLTALGISKDRVVFVREPSTFERITVPESSIAISDGDCYMSKGARAVWKFLNKKMSSETVNSYNALPKKIYVSRAAVKNPIQGRALINETELEAYLKKRDYTIIVPEAYSQQEMQVLLSKAEVIMGAPGSGLQNSFFIPNEAMTFGLTTEAIVKINPGLNHQIHTDKICGHKTHAYIADMVSDASSDMRWVIDIKKLGIMMDEKKF